MLCQDVLRIVQKFFRVCFTLFVKQLQQYINAVFYFFAEARVRVRALVAFRRRSDYNVSMDANIDIIKQKLLESFRFYAVGEGHSIVKHIRDIRSNAKPNPERQFVAEGIWLNKAIDDAGLKLRAVVLCPDLIRTAEVAAIAHSLCEKCEQRFTVSERVFGKIAEKDRPDGILSVAYLPHWDLDEIALDDMSVILVLDGVEIPGNVGTMMRVADGAGLDAVFICNRKARMTHPKLIQASMGSLFTLPFVEFESADECAAALQKLGFEVYLTDSRAEKAYFDYPYGTRTAFVMGSERYGISRGWYDKPVKLVSIPMFGKCDSLNVGVAATVVSYEASLKNKGLIRR